MKAVVFAGPSLARVSDPEGWRQGPARQGDVYRAALRGLEAIGLVDGYFEAVPSVWHKEVLFALSRGIHVFGAASIGALRAVELAPFGMYGVGRVFEAFRDGTLVDDDEVALLHGPAEAGYPPVTEAMVNIRATLEAAILAGVIGAAAAVDLAARAKSMFYKERTWQALLTNQAELAAWLPAHRVDQKRQDALALLDAMRAHHGPPLAAGFTLASSAAWERAREAMEASG